MKLIIDINENVYTRLFDNGIQDNEIATDDICEMARALRLGTPIPDNATNGDVIKAMFPNAKIVETDREVFLYTGAREKDEDIQIFDIEWWNAPYQKGGKE